MPNAQMTEIEQLPSALRIYSAALKSKPGYKPGISLPDIGLRQKAVSVDTERLSAYREICAYKDSPYLPPLYPQILSFPLQMSLLVDPGFPLPAMGLVHLSNHIKVLKPLPVSEKFDLSCYMGEQRDSDKGLEFDIITEIAQDGDILWQGNATMLCRHKQSKSERSPQRETPPPLAHSLNWEIPANTGRRYAKPSGDRNPIHLHPVTAKLFGFKRAIAHGMWTKARALADLESLDATLFTQTPYRVETSFKLPLYLPATVQFQHEQHGKETLFEVRDKSGQKPHLKGRIIKES